MKDLIKKLRPLGRILNLRDEGWAVWDCSPIRGEDGRVHVFASRWPDSDKPDADWCKGSQIIHAVADDPTGPYTVQHVVREGNGSDERWDASALINPKVYRFDDRYCLVYTGCCGGRHDSQAIGMLVADDLDGPWEAVGEDPLLSPLPDRSGFDGYLCNNPTLVRHPNGQYWLYYKGRPVTEEADGQLKAGEMRIGVAVADCLTGPYRRHPQGPLDCDALRAIEDPTVWHDGETFNMIVSTLSTMNPVGGLLLHSTDGLHWSDPVPAYPSPSEFLGRRQRLEEPNLLFTDGRPSHLFNVLPGCPEDPITSGYVFEIHGEPMSRVACNVSTIAL